MRGRPTIAVAAVLIAGWLSACGGASAEEGGVHPALCEAITAPDAAQAATIFEERVHRPLHELADETSAVDRAVATRLLEAKFAVETVVRGDTEAPDALVRQRLVDLDEQVRAARAALDRPAPAAC